MSKKRRGAFNPMSLAFLDVMSCGFGAVVLIFLILDHQDSVRTEVSDPALQAEVQMLEEEIRDGQENLVRIRNTRDEVSLEVVEAQGLATRIQEQINDFLQQLAALENTTVASEEDLERLRADIRSLEEELQRLQSSAIEQTGSDARAFVGEGDRQYLTGMFLGGNRILILLDTSASMLDETLVNIIRTRNMSDQNKKEAGKWQRAVRTVEWISSQLPIASQYQVYGFSTEVNAALEGTEGNWLEVADRDQLNDTIEAVKDMIPANGTNLARVFQAAAQLSPPPDNIYLITDGLPTLSNNPSNATLVTPQRRLELFDDAIEYLPNRTPVNVILLPLEGDPSASAAYWQLAQMTRGSFLSPARDWP
ncbi:MAG: VWA domain-containing protein [Pseudomonadales bacterium]|nr:VWA domain-containing protein [Pseudomonadales bacterium]MCP5357665.1 VWA domain-containing protein [Pseudomonadales bacterium]